MEADHIAYALLIEHGCQQPCQTKPKAAVRRAAKKDKLDGFLVSDGVNKPSQGDTISDFLPGILNKSSFHALVFLIRGAGS
jgi:hypothetical protein